MCTNASLAFIRGCRGGPLTGRFLSFLYGWDGISLWGVIRSTR